MKRVTAPVSVNCSSVGRAGRVEKVRNECEAVKAVQFHVEQASCSGSVQKTLMISLMTPKD